MKYANVVLSEDALLSLQHALSDLHPEDLEQIKQGLQYIEDERMLEGNRLPSSMLRDRNGDLKFTVC